WSSAPFAVLLVTPEREFLLRHPRPSADFKPLGYDSLLKADVFARARQYSPQLLATFPAVGGIPTIVIGQAEQTGKSSTEWVLTLLHEHFHQLQMSEPGYFSAVDSLQLSHGDQSGMWMLNYAFPYDSMPIQQRFRVLANTLATALAVRGTASFAARYAAHVKALASLREALAPGDYRYFEFQLWQEGVARYTEERVAQLAARRQVPGPSFRALPDFTPYEVVAGRLEARMLAEVHAAELARTRRVAFYPLGAATALLLDAARPGWQQRYFQEPFSLDPLLVKPALPE
ncbi:MAG TPA: hypothetical protein VGP61_10910, partial [Gemmatimonadales bacterium]|nr:hypothetical protein [Gemmatimonadales bacterium]